MNSTSLLWVLIKIILGIMLFAGFLGLIALWFQRRSPKYRASIKTKPVVASVVTTTTATVPAPAATPTPPPASGEPALDPKSKQGQSISMKWLVWIVLIWTVILTSWDIWYHPQNWKRDLLVAGVTLSVLLVVGSPYLSTSEDKKKDNKNGSTFGKFIGNTLKFFLKAIIFAPIWLLLFGAFYLWIWLPSYRSTYGIEEPRGHGVSKTFPYKISIPISPDPTGAYSAPLYVQDGGKVQFDWNNFPKNVWLDICWNGKDVTRMNPVNHSLWKQPWGTNIHTIEFKAVLVPAGTTSVELGYNLK